MQKRIVIADDDPTMRAAVGESLSSAGYNASLYLVLIWSLAMCACLASAVLSC